MKHRQRAEHVPSQVFCYGTHVRPEDAMALALSRVREAVEGASS
jgi:hypothetical protein